MYFITSHFRIILTYIETKQQRACAVLFNLPDTITIQFNSEIFPLPFFCQECACVCL